MTAPFVLRLSKDERSVFPKPATAPSAETLEQAAEQEWGVEEEAEMSVCSIEGEGQGSSTDFAVAAR